MILAIDQLGVSSKSYETALPAVSSKKGQPCQAQFCVAMQLISARHAFFGFISSTAEKRLFQLQISVSRQTVTIEFTPSLLVIISR
jgi:hypothetical protein